jgi:hypothetical protein
MFVCCGCCEVCGTRCCCVRETGFGACADSCISTSSSGEEQHRIARKPRFFLAAGCGCGVRPEEPGNAAFSLGVADAALLLPVLPSLRRPVRLRFEPRPMLSGFSLTAFGFPAACEPLVWFGKLSACPPATPAASCPLEPVLRVLLPSPVNEGSRDDVRGGGARGCDEDIGPA